jgi:uncharacterized membrane protein
MSSSPQSPWITAAALGAVAGARSMAAPAVIARALPRGPAPRQSPGRQLASPVAARVLTVLSLGELVADKLPGVPNRNAPFPLLGRALSGALVGATVGAAAGGGRARNGAIGAIAAVLATEATYLARRQVGERTGLPSAVLGALEDAAVLALAGWAAAHVERREGTAAPAA